LGDELCSVELGDDGFKNFVADGGEDAFVIVLAKRLEQLLVMEILSEAGREYIKGRSKRKREYT
jgi:hypothetical protein